jgi:hypothetical protein
VEALSGHVPASSLAGGGGPAGEKQEELKGYLWGCSTSRGMDGFGLAAKRGGRRLSGPQRRRPSGHGVMRPSLRASLERGRATGEVGLYNRVVVEVSRQ